MKYLKNSCFYEKISRKGKTDFGQKISFFQDSSIQKLKRKRKRVVAELRRFLPVVMP